MRLSTYDLCYIWSGYVLTTDQDKYIPICIPHHPTYTHWFFQQVYHNYHCFTAFKWLSLLCVEQKVGWLMLGYHLLSYQTPKIYWASLERIALSLFIFASRCSLWCITQILQRQCHGCRPQLLICVCFPWMLPKPMIFYNQYCFDNDIFSKIALLSDCVDMCNDEFLLLNVDLS